ncbi:MAG TPA: hypothetical protein VIT85_03550 [Solirubrobacterales bacterium]
MMMTFGKRVLATFGAAAFLGLAVAGSASATTVYNYVYSGDHFDGSAAGKAFNSGIGGIEYDRTDKLFLVGNDGTPGWIQKIKADGTGVAFTGLGSSRVEVEDKQFNFYTGLPNSQIAIDQTGGPNDGNFYTHDAGAFSAGVIHAYNADGTPIAGSWPDGEESRCGLVVDPPDGEDLLVMGRNGQYHFSLSGDLLKTETQVGSPGMEPGVTRKWEERGKVCRPVVDNDEFIYGGKYGGFAGFQRVVKMSQNGLEQYEVNTDNSSTGVNVDHSTNDVFVIANNQFEYFDDSGRRLGNGFGTPDPGRSYEGLTGSPIGITVDPESHDVWIANHRDYAGVARVEKFEAIEPHVIPETTSITPGYDDPTGETVTLRGTVNPDNVATTDCYFEWGSTQSLGNVVPCLQGDVFTGSSTQQVSTVPIAFKKGSRFFYKLFAKNANNQLAPSDVEFFIPQGKPIVATTVVDRVKTDGARLRSQFDPNGGNVSVHFEYGVKGGPLDLTTPESDTFGFETTSGQFSGEDAYKPGVYEEAMLINNLQPGTAYEYVAVVTNEAGSVVTPAQEFITYQLDAGKDDCINALARRQSGSSLLMDCRGYELVSPRNAGGFDVESDTVEGQVTLDAYPRAADKVLFSMHFGVPPGIAGSPTNLGLDPYVSELGPNGWTTRYVGLPADGMEDDGAFGSPLLEATPTLGKFAFGGKDICDPCFADGTTNIPLRLEDGDLVEGMAGSLDPLGERSQSVRKAFSADGSHLVFGSEAQYEAEGSAEGSIYDRNLETDETQVVSTLPDGTTMAGGEVGGLDVSEDGGRILVGQRISIDTKGNEFWHLYMHIGDDPESVEITPGVTDGVLFDGMSEDGSRVFFTTWDNLGGDTDESADVYEAFVDGSGNATVRPISIKDGSISNDDSCTPSNEPDSWNAITGDGKCSAVAFAGGAGLAEDEGSFYFLSPELLDGGQGEQNQANLYVVGPGGDPEFVTVMDSSVGNEDPTPPDHPIENPSFIKGLNKADTIAVDQTNGDIYVSQQGNGTLARFTSTGTPKNFTEGPGAGTNKIEGIPFGSSESQIAVDSAPTSPLKGTLYLSFYGGSIYAISNAGEFLGEINGLSGGCGVSVDQTNGDVYVGEYGAAKMSRFRPKPTAGGAIDNSDYEPRTGISLEMNPCNVEAGPLGNVYARDYFSNTIKQFPKSEFSLADPLVSGDVVSGGSPSTMQSDPSNGDLYVDEETQLAVYSGDTGKLIQKFGKGSISGSKGVAIHAATGTIYASNGSALAKFGTTVAPFRPINNPAILHGSQQSGVHSFGDFQVTPNGSYAVFASTQSVTGYPNFKHSEIYRHDLEADEIDCASCPPTLGAPVVDTTLPAHGLAVTDDGRVFFTSPEALALRDTNERSDVYEWSNGVVNLISAGINANDSGLVTVTADGENAFFYTRDILTHEDENGQTIKIYTAREGGGVVNDPARKECAASDECHGPGTEAPPPPAINTVTGSEKPNVLPKKKKCAKGKVKRKGKCVKKSKKKKSKKNRKSTNGRG